MVTTIEYFGLTFKVSYDYDEEKTFPITITNVRTNDNLVELLYCTDNGSRLKALERLVTEELLNVQ